MSLDVAPGNIVLCGINRLKAAKDLGLQVVPIRNVNIAIREEQEVHARKDNLLRRQLTPEQASLQRAAIIRAKERKRGEHLKTYPRDNNGRILAPTSSTTDQMECKGAFGPICSVVKQIGGKIKTESSLLTSEQTNHGQSFQHQKQSKRDIWKETAQELGVSKGTLCSDMKYAEAVEEFPELKELPKTHVIEIAKQLRSTPEPVRQEKLQQLRVVQEEGDRKIAQIDHEYKIRKTIDDAIGKMCCLTLDPERLDIWLKSRQFNELAFKETELDTAIRNITVLKKHLQSVKQGPRLVSGGGKA